MLCWRKSAGQGIGKGWVGASRAMRRGTGRGLTIWTIGRGVDGPNGRTRAFWVMSLIYVRPLAMAALALTLAVGTAGCQTMSDLDPTGLLGGDDNAMPETQFPPDSQQQ